MPRSTRTSRRMLALGLAAALGSGLLAGCASDDGKKDDNAGSGGGGGKTTLTLGVFGVFGLKEAGLYDQYMKLHPNITIKQTSIERTDVYFPQLLTHLASSSGLADIQAVEVGNISEITSQHANQFMDLSKASGFDKNSFVPWKLAQATSKDGKVIGAGTDIGPEAICYRKDLFKAAGLPTDREAVAKLWQGDWSKYVDTGKQYMQKAPKGTAFMDSAAGLYNASINGYAQRYYDNSGKVVYKDSPSVKASWNLAMDAVKGKMTAKYKQFTPQWDSGYANAKFATVACPPWMLGYIKDKAGAKGEDKWDVAQAPKPANWGGSFLAVPEAGKHKDEAAKLAAWLTAPKQQATLFQKQASFPSSQAAYDLPAVADAKHEYFDNAPIGKIFSVAAKGIPTLVLGPKDQPIGTQITDVGILQVEQQGKSPATGWSAAGKKIDDLLDQ
jgi:cellobiose transport system substrate-binding protein